MRSNCSTTAWRVAVGAALLVLCACGSGSQQAVDGDGHHAGDALGKRDASPTKKPNILLIVADDMGYNDLAINNGNTTIDTPNLDQLARDGVRFTRHYGSPVCSPARAALLTGLYPERVGFQPDARGISAQIVTLPERLQEEGYATWHIGKWHLGYLDRDAWPDRQGFDHWFGFLDQWHLAGVHKTGRPVPAKPRYMRPWLDSDSEPGKIYPGHLDDILTAKAIAVISQLQAQGSPWFVNLWFLAPHNPVTPAREFAAKYPDTRAGKYRALVNQLDHNIGRLVTHLKKLGALQNTIVVVVSDNGAPKVQIGSNKPFVGAKGDVNEGGTHTPLIIRWPDRSLDGQVYPAVVSIADIYPSLLAAIGAAVPAQLDGKSFYQGMLHPGSNTERALFWEFGSDSFGVLSADGDWRLYQPMTFLGVKQAPILYDLAHDPAGSRPLIPLPAEPLAQLTAAYASWYRDVHTVNTVYTPAGNGGGVLTGTDFLRAPGFGPYTFGIGISDDTVGPIAAQRGVWELRRAGNTVTAHFGDTVLSGELQKSGGCHSIVISGMFWRDITTSTPPDSLKLTLYLDGIEAQTIEAQKLLAVDDFTAATVIGDPESGSTVGSLRRPVILNTQLDAHTPWSLDAFTHELCSD